MKFITISFLIISCVFAQSRDIDLGRASSSRGSGGVSINLANGITSFNSFSNHARSIEASNSISKDSIQKEFRFRPQLEVNTNLGHLKNSFSIQLPNNLSPLKNLNFVYNSSLQRNIGYGYGWRLKLPYIEYNTLNNEYSYLGIKLIRIEKNIPEKVYTILNRLNLRGRPLKLYKKEIESDNSLYVEVLESGHVYFIELKLNGQAIVYDNVGRAKIFIDDYFNTAHITWERGRIKKIKTSAFEAQLNYLSDQTKPTFYLNSFNYLPRGLKKITFKTPKQSRSVIFENTDQMLKKVFWEGSLKNLFWGSYTYQKRNQVRIGNTRLSKDFVESFDLSGNIRRLSLKNGDQIFQYIDLNGDGHLDRLTIDTGIVNRKIRSFYKNAKSEYALKKANEKVDYYLSRTKSIPYSKVEMAIVKNNRIIYGVDNTLNISNIHKHPISLNILRTKTGKIQFDTRMNKRNGTFFVDVNNDGKKDLVYCEGSVNHESKLNSHYNALMSLSTNSQVGIENSFWTLSGNVAEVYIQKYEKNNLARMYHHGGVSEPENFILNSSKWVKNDSLDFRCSEKSLWSDFNNDGYTDVLTGNTLYYLSPSKVFKKNLTKEELFTLITIDKSLGHVKDSKNWSLVPDDKTLKLKLTHKKQLVINPKNFEMTEINQNGVFLPVRVSKVPLLTEVKSKFGGMKKISYKYRDMNWVVSKITTDTDDSDQPNSEVTYNYKGHIQDPVKGVHNGYIFLSENYNYNSPNRENQQIKTEYTLDLNDKVQFLNSRPRFNGRVLEKQWLDSKGKVFKLLSNSWGIAEFEKRYRIYLLEKEIADMDTIDYYYKKDVDRFELLDRQGLIATKVRTSMSELADFDAMFGKDLHDRYVEKEDTYTLNWDQYRLVKTKSTRKKDRNAQTTYFKYNDKYSLINKRLGSFEINLDYDQFGRMIKLEDQKGSFQKTKYLRNTKLPYEITGPDRKDLFIEYDFVNSKLLTYKKGELTYFFNYSSDGVLLSTERKNCNACSESLIMDKTVDFKHREVNVKKFGRNRIFYLDGLGRVVQERVPYKRPLYTGHTIFDTDDNALKVSLPTHNMDDRTYYIKTFLDAGLKLKHIERFSDNHTFKYEGRCQIEFINGIYQELYCKRNDGKIVAYRARKAKFKLKYELDGHLNMIDGKIDGLSYFLMAQRDENLRPTRIGFFSTDANSEGYSFDYNDIENTINIDDKKKIIKDESNRIISIERINSKSLRNYESNLLSRYSLFVNDKKVIQEKYEYNSAELLRRITGKDSIVSYNYNDYDQVVNVEREDKSFQTKLNYKYDYDRVVEVAPYVKNINYDAFGNITDIAYSSGSSVHFNYINNRLSKIADADRVIKYSYTQDHKIKSINHNENDLTITYNKKGNLSNSPTINKSSFNNKGQMKYYEDYRLEWGLTELRKISGKNKQFSLFYDDADKLQLLCDKERVNSDCFHWKSYSEVYYKNNFANLITVKGKALGAMVNGKFFEITTDHLGSIISIKDNGVEVVSREYGLWGERKVKVKSGYELIDKMIVWNYAGLIIPPNVDIEGLYWSTSRVYSSKLKHWLSVDPMILLNIDRMSQKINDLNAIRYCNNDPVNFVDPSGYYTIFVGTGGGAGGGTAARGSTGLWINKDPNKAWSPFSGGHYATTEIGGHYGMSAGAGAEFGFVTGFRSDFEGHSTVHGGSGGFLGKFGADYTFTQSGAHGGSFSIEFGAGGAGYQRVGHTWAFDAAPDSLMGRVIDFANDFYNEHWGTEPSYFDYNSDNYSFGDWSFDTSL